MFLQVPDGLGEIQPTSAAERLCWVAFLLNQKVLCRRTQERIRLHLLAWVCFELPGQQGSLWPAQVLGPHITHSMITFLSSSANLTHCQETFQMSTSSFPCFCMTSISVRPSVFGGCSKDERCQGQPLGGGAGFR